MAIITLDLETTGLNWKKDAILLCGYRVDRGEISYDSEALKPLVNDINNTLRGANIKFDALFLANNGFNISCQLEDTRILAYLTWPHEESHSLKHLVRTKLGLKPKELDEIQFKPLKKDLPYLQEEDYYRFSDGKYVRKDLLQEYHKEDILNVDRLYDKMHPSKWFKEVEMPLTKLLFDMELAGCPTDIRLANELLSRFTSRSSDSLSLVQEYYRGIRSRTRSLQSTSVQLRFPSPAGNNNRLQQMEPENVVLLHPRRPAGAKTDIEEEKDFNPNSSEQVRQLFKLKGYNLEQLCEKTPKGAYCVDKAFLKTLAWKGDEEAKTLLEYRKYAKLLSTYISVLVENPGSVHGSINQAGSEDSYGEGKKGTNTGRLSSSNPNLQNIPSRTKEGKEIRKCFIASPGKHMFDSDLAQIEPRLVAHFTQAPKLIQAYASGADTHGLFACDIFDKQDVKDLVGAERFIGKTSWLATVYGCSYKKLLKICENFSDEPLQLNLEPYYHLFDKQDLHAKKELVRDYGEDARKVHAEWMFFKNVQDKFKAKNPEIFSWRSSHIDRTKRSGYVTTLGGRRIQIDGLWSNSFKDRNIAERQAVNYLIQGSAADIMKLILVRFGKEFTNKGLGRIFATVHDEVLGELNDPKDLAVVKDLMENTVKLNNVKIESDTKLVKSWGEK